VEVQMTELSRRARSIIEEAKRADTPSAADKQRIRNKLIARLGAGALVSSAVIGSSASSAASGAGAAGSTSASGGFGAVTGLAGATGTGAVGLTTKITLISAIVGAIGVGAVTAPWDEITSSSNEKNGANADRSEQATPQTATSPAAQTQQSATDESAAKTQEKNTLSLSSSDGMRQPIRVDEANNNNITPHLEAELKLLRAAQVALQKGDSNRALSVLNKHRRQFPGGLLRQEREAARAVALCELGRYEQGRQVAQRLLANSPRSPLAQRIARSCNR
jgi:hypothetical protein